MVALKTLVSELEHRNADLEVRALWAPIKRSLVVSHMFEKYHRSHSKIGFVSFCLPLILPLHSRIPTRPPHTPNQVALSEKVMAVTNKQAELEGLDAVRSACLCVTDMTQCATTQKSSYTGRPQQTLFHAVCVGSRICWGRSPSTV